MGETREIKTTYYSTEYYGRSKTEKEVAITLTVPINATDKEIDALIAEDYLIWRQGELKPNIEFKKVKDQEPYCWESGDWDGRKSDPLLVYTSDKEYHVATAYSGTMGGSKFLQFYDNWDYEIEDVTHWAELPHFPV